MPQGEPDERVVMALLDGALDMDTADRMAWLHQKCGADPALLTRVLRLLDLAQAGPALMATMPPQAATLPPAGPPPARIGSYALGELIGAGGMGAVYRAARDDGVFDQTVAIKLMRHGRMSDQARQQFDTERRILARMHHRYIAQLFDGGVLEDGTSYIIMELVDGESLDHHCRRDSSNERQILTLFQQVCQAIQYAHQSLVVHGDIKPSNILVTGDAQVKLLDFGIAQLTSADPATVSGEPMPLTLAFAAPERLQGGPPTLASDVFALGKVLESLFQGKALSRDLAAIIRKCTARAAADRYVSAAALSDDVDRYLTLQPVEARGVDWRYGVHMFIRRHRWAVTAAALAVVGLIAALGITSILYVRAERARTVAASRFNDVRSMAGYMLYTQYDQLEDIPGTLKVRAGLLSKSQTFLERLAANNNPPPDLALDIGLGFARLAEVQRGRFGSSSMEQIAQAERNLAAADAVLTRALQTHASRDDLKIALAKVRSNRCSKALYNDHGFPKATAFAQSVESLLAGVKSLDADIERWAARNCRGDVQTWLDHPHAAMTILNRERQAALARIGTRPATEQELLLLGQTSRFLAEAAYYAHDYAGSVAHANQALKALNMLRTRHPNSVRYAASYVAALLIKGESYIEGGKNYDLAAQTLKEGSDIYRRIYAKDPDDQGTLRRLLSLEGDHAKALSLQGKYDEALALVDEVNRHHALLLQKSPRELDLVRAQARALAPRAEILKMAGRMEEACLAYRRALAAWQAFDRQFGITASDKAEEVVPLEAAIKRCAKPV